MIQLHDIRYVRLGTRDLASATRFATEIVGLQLAAQEAGTAYFRSDRAAIRGDTRDHTLAYFEGDPTDHIIGIELRDPDDLDALGAALEHEGRQVHRGTRAECDARRTHDFIAATDPSGNRIEFLARPYNTGTRFQPTRDIGIENFSHIGLFSTDPRRDTAFWTRVLNARVSDWLGEATFLRINTVHHSIVLMPSTRPGIQHINHQVEDIDDVMRSYYWLKQQGVKIVYGPGRHPISTAMMVYFEGPDGMVWEYSVGVKHILPEQEAGYRPRQFTLDGYNADMWGSFHETEGLPREPVAARRMRLVV